METVELILKLYPAQGLALTVYDELMKVQKVKKLHFRNAALLECDEHGETSFVEAWDLDPTRGAVFGAAAGGLVGLLGGTVGVIIGVVAGAITGAIVAGMFDRGFQNEFLKQINLSLVKDTSAVLVLVEEKWAEEVVSEMNRMPGKLFRHALKSQLAAQIKQALDETQKTDP